MFVCFLTKYPRAKCSTEHPSSHDQLHKVGMHVDVSVVLVWCIPRNAAYNIMRLGDNMSALLKLTDVFFQRLQPIGF